MTDAKIITLQPEDIEDYILMHKASWLATYPNEEIGLSKAYLEEFLNRKPLKERIESLELRIKNDDLKGLRILKLDNRVIGVCDVEVVNLRDEKFGKIRMLYLHPDYIGKGYGSQLMNFAFELLIKMGVHQLIVEVADYNQRAIKFYQKFDFSNPEKIEDFKLGDKISIPQIRLYKKF